MTLILKQILFAKAILILKQRSNFYNFREKKLDFDGMAVSDLRGQWLMEYKSPRVCNTSQIC